MALKARPVLTVPKGQLVRMAQKDRKALKVHRASKASRATLDRLVHKVNQEPMERTAWACLLAALPGRFSPRLRTQITIHSGRHRQAPAAAWFLFV